MRELACAHCSVGVFADLKEFGRCLRCAKITPAQLSNKDIAWLFSYVDTDSSGSIDIDEFCECLVECGSSIMHVV